MKKLKKKDVKGNLSLTKMAKIYAQAERLEGKSTYINSVGEKIIDTGDLLIFVSNKKVSK